MESSSASAATDCDLRPSRVERTWSSIRLLLSQHRRGGGGGFGFEERARDVLAELRSHRDVFAFAGRNDLLVRGSQRGHRLDELGAGELDTRLQVKGFADLRR